jgi:hypothetical protein
MTRVLILRKNVSTGRALHAVATRFARPFFPLQTPRQVRLSHLKFTKF